MTPMINGKFTELATLLGLALDVFPPSLVGMIVVFVVVLGVGVNTTVVVAGGVVAFSSRVVKVIVDPVDS